MVSAGRYHPRPQCPWQPEGSSRHRHHRRFRTSDLRNFGLWCLRSGWLSPDLGVSGRRLCEGLDLLASFAGLS